MVARPCPPRKGAADARERTGDSGEVHRARHRQRSKVGFEIEKRTGTPSYSRNIVGGGALAAGAKLHEFGDELVATDGGTVYSWSPALSQWMPRGRCTSVAARVSLVDGTPASTSLYTDAAAFGNYVLVVVGRIASGTIRYFVRDATTGATVATGSFNGEAPRLAVVGTSVFVFYHAVSDVTPNIGCRTISASTPTRSATLCPLQPAPPA